ncbi:Hypothetical predicted protein, partial [Olea europaea subsp. europaea]
VRPTSETIVNHMFTQWIHSYRDQPSVSSSHHFSFSSLGGVLLDKKKFKQISKELTKWVKRFQRTYFFAPSG